MNWWYLLAVWRHILVSTAAVEAVVQQLGVAAAAEHTQGDGIKPDSTTRPTHSNFGYP